MNRIFRASGLTAFALLALALPASAQADVAGNWTIEVQGPEGPAMVMAALQQSGADVTGSLEVEMFGTVEMAGGAVEENILTFTLDLDFDGMPFTIEVTAEIDGDDMKGSFYVADFGNMPFTGKRSDG